MTRTNMEVTARHFVYVLQSMADPERHYVGMTSDITSRLASHNDGGSPHTARYRPWKLIVLLAFADASRAASFEKYLKSGAGRAFVRHHYLGERTGLFGTARQDDQRRAR